jgi:hypothetical protein
MGWLRVGRFAIVLAGAAVSCADDRTSPSRLAAAPSIGVARAGVPVQETWFPAQGDCGRVDATGHVKRAPCRSFRADVVVDSIQWGGDPGYLCPLLTRTSVLVSELPDGWFACWVRIGRPPLDRFPDAGVEAVVAQGVQAPSVGACGDIPRRARPLHA